MKFNRTALLNLSLLFCSLVPFVALQSKEASAVTLQNGTATFSQQIFGGPYTPDHAVDGNFGDPNGWSVGTSATFGGASSQTAVWETATDVAAGQLDFTMHFLHSNPGHLLGRFRFSVTTDDRNTFADGLDVGGDVAANWIELTNPIVSGPAGMTFNTLADNSILAGGTTAATGVYNVSYSTTIDNITGIRLEAIEHPSLPAGDGPGLHIDNGNFVLTEMTLDSTPMPPVTSTPEPSTLLGLGTLALASGTLLRRRRKV